VKGFQPNESLSQWERVVLENDSEALTTEPGQRLCISEGGCYNVFTLISK